MMFESVPFKEPGDEELTSFRHDEGHGLAVGGNAVRQQPNQLFRPIVEKNELLESVEKLEFASDEFERDPNHAGSARFEEEKEAD